MTHVKFVDKNMVLYAPLNLVLPDKTILNFRYDEELMMEYGYKPLIEVEIVYDSPFHIEYEETENEVKEVIVYDSLVDDSGTLDDSSDSDVDSEQAE